jgi:hypothetical protein
MDTDSGRLRTARRFLCCRAVLPRFRPEAIAFIALRANSRMGRFARAGRSRRVPRERGDCISQVLWLDWLGWLLWGHAGDGFVRWKVVLERSEEAGYAALVPALPGCVSEGDTRAQALANIRRP